MSPKKLIEVALPLEAINVASAREKSIRHGHPSTLHLWWARRPLAACRAVLFASLVDDPSSHPELFPTEEAQQRERERLFRIIEELVKWENTNNEQVLAEVRAEIMRSTGGNPPPVYDPFAGGGSIPLEAQRLGLEAHASDLNPVAVLICKALIEIPPKFAGMPPVNPADRNQIGVAWKGAAGLAADVRYYGKWMRDEAERRIGHLYPKVRLPKEYGGGEAIVIAWLWARTVKCPNPACGAQMPLVKSFWLSTKAGGKAWLTPIARQTTRSIWFDVSHGEPGPSLVSSIANGASFVRENGKKIKATFNCLICKDSIVKGDYVDNEANAKRMGVMPLAVVAEAQKGRIYLPVDESVLLEMTSAVESTFSLLNVEDKSPNEPAHGTFASNAQGRTYGFRKFADYFMKRQLIALTTLSDLVGEVHSNIQQDAIANKSLEAKAYANAVATYLGLAVSRTTNTICSLAVWSQSRGQSVNVFSRQALPMTWDFPEVNPFAGAAGDFAETTDSMAKTVASIRPARLAEAIQFSAFNKRVLPFRPMISTDPPYYGNIGYADLADFFYVWLRRSLGRIYPDLFNTLLTPKEEELVATPHRFNGDRQMSQDFFEEGLGKAFGCMHEMQHRDYPLTVFYAYKQSENEDEEDEALPIAIASTGWETMLEGLISASLTITGTWPMRTERPTGVKVAVNALASSIVLVCRPRLTDAKAATRREFLNALKAELPEALRLLQKGNVAPVDLAQAAIGPGMAVFSRYSKVIEADGTAMRVRTALQIINQELDMVLAEQEGEFDADTRWAIAWFDQFGANEGAYGTAETLSKAKNTSVGGMVEAGIAVARGGKVRLLKRDELPEDWNPASDRRLTIWEITQHLVHALDKRGEIGAAALLVKVGGEAEIARDLAYRLYTTCERKGWAQEALAYNSLVVAWPEITRQATERRRSMPTQERFNI